MISDTPPWVTRDDAHIFLLNRPFTEMGLAGVLHHNQSHKGPLSKRKALKSFILCPCVLKVHCVVQEVGEIS